MSEALEHLDPLDPRVLMAAPAPVAPSGHDLPGAAMPVGHIELPVPQAPAPYAEPEDHPPVLAVPTLPVSMEEAAAAQQETMTYYVGIDAEGVAQMHGHAPTRLYPPMPLPGITYLEVSAEEELMCRDCTFQLAVAPGGNGVSFPALAPWTRPSLPMQELRNRAIARIDTEAERVRLSMITAGAGQALVYQQKRDEAQRFLAAYADGTAAQAAAAEDWPIIAAEVGVTGHDLWTIANTMDYLARSWTLAAAEIERVRLTAKAAVAAAATPEAVASVLAGLAWPSMAAPAS